MRGEGAIRVARLRRPSCECADSCLHAAVSTLQFFVSTMTTLENRDHTSRGYSGSTKPLVRVVLP